MRSLVWRYITAMHRRQEESEVTEDDVNEVKGEISTLRFELLEVFKNNGMDISTASKNTKAALGRKMRIWERRLLRDFSVVTMAGEEDETEITGEEDPNDRFRKLAMVAVKANFSGELAQGSTTNVKGVPGKRQIKTMSQIGKSMSNESFKSSQNLQKAIEEANRLTIIQPTPEPSPRGSPFPGINDTGSSVLELINSMKNAEEDHGSSSDEEGGSHKPATKAAPTSGRTGAPFFAKNKATGGDGNEMKIANRNLKFPVTRNDSVETENELQPSISVTPSTPIAPSTEKAPEPPKLFKEPAKRSNPPTTKKGNGWM
jgi:hypothetical protein